MGGVLDDAEAKSALGELGSTTGGLQTVLHWFFAKIPPYIGIFSV